MNAFAIHFTATFSFFLFATRTFKPLLVYVTGVVNCRLHERPTPAVQTFPDPTHFGLSERLPQQQKRIKTARVTRVSQSPFQHRRAVKVVMLGAFEINCFDSNHLFATYLRWK